MQNMIFLVLGLSLIASPLTTLASGYDGAHGKDEARHGVNVQLGPRPYFLVDDMSPGPLKNKLQSCSEGPFRKSDFSIGHRGAPLQFPEHTKESYEAAARMGAGILECDVAFTQDEALVCRHSQCDLHTTTNILETPLAAKCSAPFTPAEYDSTGKLIKPASAQCCTSDITVAEFKTLRGKMDASNSRARTAAEYMGGTANFRTDLYSGPSSGTLMTHRESIELFKKLGTKMTPELKFPSVPMPFNGFTQEAYAQKLIDEYKAAGVSPRKVFAQSFHLPDVLYWIGNEPAFGEQAVFLDDIDPTDSNPNNDQPRNLSELRGLYAQGVRFLAPPMWALLTLDSSNAIVPSPYARDAKAAGLELITWTLERSGILADGDGGWYYQTINPALKNEGAAFEALHVLAKDVGVRGVFSDWPATTTYYANCMRIK